MNNYIGRCLCFKASESEHFVDHFRVTTIKKLATISYLALPPAVISLKEFLF